MSFARSSCNTLGTARPRPLASRFHSICDCPKFCGPGDYRVHTPLMKTGCLPVRTVEANCRTGRVRFTRRTCNRRRKKSESWAISVGTRSGTRTRRSSRGNGEDVKVVQELMRHANISVTLNVYAQAITQTKRDAQSRVVSLLLDKRRKNQAPRLIGP